jgi:hypothetical protein
VTDDAIAMPDAQAHDRVLDLIGGAQVEIANPAREVHSRIARLVVTPLLLGDCCQRCHHEGLLPVATTPSHSLLQGTHRIVEGALRSLLMVR